MNAQCYPVEPVSARPAMLAVNPLGSLAKLAGHVLTAVAVVPLLPLVVTMHLVKFAHEASNAVDHGER